VAEVEFRTGKREIPDYQADLMQGLPTHKMTYDEAIAAMNRKMAGDFVNSAVDKIVINHFVEQGRS
jgi:hypothetical protein